MQSGESVAVERGFALIAILALAALFSAFLIASALNFTSAGISNEREQRSMNALRQAKAALIAYAARTSSGSCTRARRPINPARCPARTSSWMTVTPIASVPGFQRLRASSAECRGNL